MHIVYQGCQHKSVDRRRIENDDFEGDVVAGFGVSTRARYMVRANGVDDVQEVDQSAVTDWISLGEYDFAQKAYKV